MPSQVVDKTFSLLEYTSAHPGTLTVGPANSPGRPSARSTQSDTVLRARMLAVASFWWHFPNQLRV